MQLPILGTSVGLPLASRFCLACRRSAATSARARASPTSRTSLPIPSRRSRTQQQPTNASPSSPSYQSGPITSPKPTAPAVTPNPSAITNITNSPADALTTSSPITPASFAAYTLSPAPLPAQLAYAHRFFTTSRPAFLFSSPKFRTLPPSSVPEVAFLGRSNVGKSSLLNALLHRTGVRVAHVSGKPGRTRAMNAFAVGGDGDGVRRLVDAEGRERWAGRGAVVVLDMPGYGRASREEWGREIVKYLCGRKQLRKTFLLVDAEHGPKETDRQIAALLRANGIAHEIVLSKIDKLLLPSGKSGAAAMARNLARLPALFADVRGRLYEDEDLRRGAAMVDLLTCSSERDWPLGSGRKIGVDNLRWAVLAAAGLDCDADGQRRVMEYELQVEDGEGWVDVEQRHTAASTSKNTQDKS